jgi:hypothetical protein
MSPFAQWIGVPVILQVKTENSRASLQGTIMDDGPKSFLFQSQKGRRMFVIPKTCVLAVEEAPRQLASKSRQRHWEMPRAC